MQTSLDKATKEHYTLKEMERALRNIDKLRLAAYHGSLDSIDVIIDSEELLRQANPTDKQFACIDLVWLKNMSLTDAGTVLGITTQAVKYNINLVKVKMQRVLDLWELLDRREA